MKTLANSLITLSLVLTLSLVSTVGFAEDRLILQDAEGFCISLNQVEKITLTHRIREWRSILQEQQKQLAERVEQLKFDTLDAVITIVMPGGLLYAAVKKGNHMEKSQDLTLVTRDIKQLSDDLLAFETPIEPLQLAALQQ